MIILVVLSNLYAYSSPKHTVFMYQLLNTLGKCNVFTYNIRVSLQNRIPMNSEIDANGSWNSCNLR